MKKRKQNWYVLYYFNDVRHWLPAPTRKFARELVKAMRANTEPGTYNGHFWIVKEVERVLDSEPAR